MLEAPQLSFGPIRSVLIPTVPGNHSSSCFPKQSHPQIHPNTVCRKPRWSPIDLSLNSDVSFHTAIEVFNLAATEVGLPPSLPFRGPPLSLSFLERQRSLKVPAAWRSEPSPRLLSGTISREWRGHDQCDPSSWVSEKDQGHMSQRAAAPFLRSNRPTQSSSPSQGSPQKADPETLQDASHTPPPAGLPRPATTVTPVATESQQNEVVTARASNPEKTPISPNNSRSFGVHSILNPAQHETSEALQQEKESRLSQGTTRPLVTSRSSFMGPGNTSHHQQGRSLESSRSRPDENGPSVPTRHMLTPNSPGSATLALSSLQTRNPSVDSTLRAPGQDGRVLSEEAGKQKFVEGSPYTTFPPNASLARSTTFGSLPDPSPFAHTRRTSGGSGLGLVSRSQEPSPSTSQSSYSHISQTSPASGFGLPPRAPQGFSAIGQQVVTPHRQSSNVPTGQPSSISAGGHLFDMAHGSYEMTLDTEHGPLRVPVDVQQASHIADEKRKRNAGASARFRARRKEKEREASQTISSLEKELREAVEERDFYANERNFFRDMASRHAQVPVRPPSPRHRRLPPPPSVSPQFQADEGRGEPPPRNLRRRTSDYQPTTATAPPIAPVASRPPFGPPPAFQVPFSEIRPATGREALPPTSLPPRVDRYDPFRQGSFDRSWNPGR